MFWTFSWWGLSTIGFELSNVPSAIGEGVLKEEIEELEDQQGRE